jgi:hypothetical protein
LDTRLNIRLFLILIIPFLFYHNNTLTGPDSEVYLAVSHAIVTRGSLNILPESLPDSTPYQITRTHHAPIHQNIGGVLFIVPATALAVASHTGAVQLANLPSRFYDISYHEGMWLGCITYLLAMLACLLTYRVARCYHGPVAVTPALLATVFGGPLFLYAFFYPCNTNLPAAFLAALLLYIYHYSDMKKTLSWLLMGSVLGLGIFVRQEFAVWSLLLAYAAFQEKPHLNSWRTGLQRLLWAGCGSLLFIVPSLLLRLAVFGHQGSSYAIQADLVNLTKSYLLLWGTRNGLFVFWPILLVALTGYFIRVNKNPPLYHLLSLILVAVTITSGTIIFWNGELGHSLGQRWFLVVFPCFVLYLSRLLEQLKRYSPWIIAGCAACTIWALLLWAAYGMKWSFPGGVTGFLMPLHFSRILEVLGRHYPLFVQQLLQALFVPKHIDVIWLLPLFALMVFCALFLYNRFVSGKKFEYCFALLLLLSFVTTVFLAGAGSRGERQFREIAAVNSQATFITRNYEVNFEIVSSMVDSAAFFMESGDYRRVQQVQEKTRRFLQQEAPDQLPVFEQACAALQLRHTLGWYRLFPELVHFSLLDWYQTALVDMQNNRRPVNVLEKYLY